MDMMKDYRSQFDSLTSTIDVNNSELDTLRSELTKAQSSYYDLRTQQHTLENEVDSLKIRKELTIGINEERRLNQLKIGI